MTRDELLRALDVLPDSATLTLSVVELRPAVRDDTPPSVVDNGELPMPWNARLWSVPPETRLSRDQLLEALNRPKSWLYRRTGNAGDKPRIPHRRFDGELVFIAGEVREWLKRQEVSEGGRG